MSDVYFSTPHGKMLLGDTLQILENHVKPKSVDLIMTSPPYGLVHKKDYGNVDADDYLDWFKPFGELFKRILKDNGSLVIVIGGSWVKGQPTRSLYHFKLLIMLCEELSFHLAQEFCFFNPAAIPSPATWVTVKRIRVKNAVDCVWWLSPNPYPKANNRRVLQPYGVRTRNETTGRDFTQGKRPSGHTNENFALNNLGAIPPNLITMAHTDSNSYYHKYCKTHNIKSHSARFPSLLPEYFIRFLTNKSDLIVDPFAGSCTTGEVAERLGRRWVCVDDIEEHLKGAVGRFDEANIPPKRSDKYYKIPRPGMLWDGNIEEVPLDEDGGRARKKRANQ